MQLIETVIPEVKIIEPKAFGDERGYFFESYQVEHYAAIGIKEFFVQDNMSRSNVGVVRGLHYQLNYPQGKLVTVTRGKVFDVAVDIRHGSPTFGQWVGEILDDETHKQLYIPPGFAHGFCVLSDVADFHYKCTEYYHPEDDYGVAWNDADIDIDWPLATEAILSAKDLKHKHLTEIPVELLPKFK